MPADRPRTPSGVFRRPFREQVAYFRQKMGNLVPTRRWDDMVGAAHDTGFMVAGAQKADLLADLAASVDRAIADGKSLEAFRKDFAAAVDRHDWHGWTGEDTKAGRAWRTRTIYRTNASVSYAAGRFAQLSAEDWKFWVYLHGGSEDPRPEHLHVFNGLILPPDHPFWQKFYPPSDWGCSCYVVGANTLAQAVRLGGDPSKALPEGWDRPDPATGEPAGIGKGWGYAPGASVLHAIGEKLRFWDPEIGADFLASLPPALSTALRESRSLPVRSILDLSDEEVATVRRYTDGGYLEINEALRLDGRLTTEGEALDAIMRRALLPAERIVYRGFGGAAAGLIRDAGLEPGDVIRDAAFVSASIDRSVGEAYRVGEHGVLLIIRLRKGARALNVSYSSEAEYEAELLIHRNPAMRVVRWDATSGELEVEIDG